MKKTSVLAKLQQLKDQAETEEDKGLFGLEILTLLLEYIGDPQVTEAVDQIPFVEVRDATGNKESQTMS